jgi:hypothetical protein
VNATLHERPVNATHWSTRTVAEHLGTDATTIRRVWHSHGLKPHVSRGFKLSSDPRWPASTILTHRVASRTNVTQRSVHISAFS